jgi:hypothetical protein
MGSVTYRMTDPGYTYHHRAGLCGLADTTAALCDDRSLVPNGYKAEKDGSGAVVVGKGGKSLRMALGKDRVSLSWDDETTSYQEAMQILLDVSFQITDKGVIYMPGKGVDRTSTEAMLAEHNCCMKTILSGPGMIKCERTDPVPSLDKDGNQRYLKNGEPKMKLGDRIPQIHKFLRDEKEILIVYTPVLDYVHRQLPKAKGGFSPDAETKIDQYLVMGAVKAGSGGVAGSFRDTVANAILLRYVMVSSRIFNIAFKKKKGDSYAQSQYYCTVMPDPVKLDEYVRNTSRASVASRYRVRYESHYAAGVEEAMMRLAVDIDMVNTTELVADFEAYAVSIEPGSTRSPKRLGIRHCRFDFGEKIDIFHTAVRFFGSPAFYVPDGEKKKGKNDDPKTTMVRMPPLPVPEWLAGNLVNGRHWCEGFAELPGVLYSTPKGETSFALQEQQKGFAAMLEKVHDEQDKAFIDLIQNAWLNRMGAISEKKRGSSQDAMDRKFETEKVKIINEIRRRRSNDMLVGWITEFLALNDRGINAKAAACREFIFNPRNHNRLVNLVNFAFASYTSRSKTPKGDPTENGKNRVLTTV